VKKLLAAAFLLAFATIASAQNGRVRFGVPACAQCMTPSNPTPGVPASATSSFTAFNPPPSTGFTAFNPPPSYSVFSGSFRSRGFSGHVSVGNRGHHHHRRQSGYAIPYGYAYPLYVEPSYDAYPDQQPAAADVPSGNAMDREMWSQASERQDRDIQRANTEHANSNDARYGEHYLDDREARDAAAGPAPAVAPTAPKEEEGPALILVLLDGSKVELANYAIVGKTIYDLSHRGKKIQLAQLDMPATQKANDALGLDFRLPTR
jgi:hypothetical protein